MAEATAAPVRALMHGRPCHPGLGGGEGAGDGRGPCGPRGSAAVACPEGPPRTALPGDAGGPGSAVSNLHAPRCSAWEVGSRCFCNPTSHSVQPPRAVVARCGRTVTCEAGKVKAKVCPYGLREDRQPRDLGRPTERRLSQSCSLACACLLQACSGPSRACTREMPGLPGQPAQSLLTAIKAKGMVV